MSGYTNIDAQELWQHISTYAHGGYLSEVRNYMLSADGKDKIPDDTFWPMDKEDNHIDGW
jgi:hypothetical protein